MKLYRYLAVILLVAVSLTLSGMIALVNAQDEHEHTEPTDEEFRQLIHDVRGATVQYRDLDTAVEAGYGKFLDCFQHGPELGMGQHYVNGDLLGDDVLDPLTPEALVYEPREDGTLILSAFEYIVVADVWDPNDEGREPPMLYGQEFKLKTNIPDTPPIWALHIWLWAHNPEGMFADYNPYIVCPEDQPIVEMGDM
jgi:hypothetical protein